MESAGQSGGMDSATLGDIGGRMMHGGLLSRETLENIVIHSSIVPEGDQDISDRKTDASNARANAQL